MLSAAMNYVLKPRCVCRGIVQSSTIDDNHPTSSTSFPTYPPFDCMTEGTGVHWTKWVVCLTNNVFVGYNFTGDAQKKALVLTYGSEDLIDIFDTFSFNKITPQPNTDQAAFTKAVTALSDYFNPRQNVEFQRYQFCHTNQEQYESIDKYYTRLMQIAATYNFMDTNAKLKNNMKKTERA